MYNISNINIGEILKKYRKLRGVSLEYVGNIIFKTKSTISKYEKGEIIPDFLTFLELCNALNINISEILSFTDSNNYNLFPFDTNILYLYYLTGKKIITSKIEFINQNCKNYVTHLYNGYKIDSKSYAYCYEGNSEFFNHIGYMNFRNVNSEIEKIQIIINFPLSNVHDLYDCFITCLTIDFIPAVKRGLISTFPLTNIQLLEQKLSLSKEDLRQLSIDNFWLLNSKNYNDFFYDSDNNILKK